MRWNLKQDMNNICEEGSIKMNKKHMRIIEGALYLAAGAGIIHLIYQFAAKYFFVKKESREKQKRLDLINYAVNVQELLFVAHRKPENIELALEKIAKAAGSEHAFFKFCYEDGRAVLYQWLDSRADRELLKAVGENMDFVESRLNNAKAEAVFEDIERLKCDDYKNYSYFKAKKVRNIMAVPVMSVSGAAAGVLGISNVQTICGTAKLLDAVRVSFSMLYNNIISFNKIKEMSEVDILTKVLNRNCYQGSLENYAKAGKKSMACVYCDVNGLHEMNNAKGHEAGDKMLIFVASSMRSHFGCRHTYRIGGDEFVAFAPDMEYRDIIGHIKAIEDELKTDGYHASFGVGWSEKNDIKDIELLVKQAEENMYTEKKKYYDALGMQARDGRSHRNAVKVTEHKLNSVKN